MTTKKLKDVFYASYVGLQSLRDSGIRLIRGKQLLGEFIQRHLGRLTDMSKDNMRIILEGNDEQVDDLFNLRVVDLYSQQPSLGRIRVARIDSEVLSSRGE